MLQQVAVVARQLNHEAFAVDAEELLHAACIMARMLHPRLRVRGEIRVLRKDLRGTHELLQLHQPTALAYERVQRVEKLGRA
jgi:hypothetical protein